MYYLIAIQVVVFVVAGFFYFLHHLFEYGSAGIFFLVLFGFALYKLFNLTDEDGGSDVVGEVSAIRETAEGSEHNIQKAV